MIFLSLLITITRVSTQNITTGHVGFERALGLLDSWIDNELGGWKKHSKLSKRLKWMSNRLAANLNDGCVLLPTKEDIDTLDNVWTLG